MSTWCIYNPRTSFQWQLQLLGGLIIHTFSIFFNQPSLLVCAVPLFPPPPTNDVDRFEQARHDDECRSQKLARVAPTLANVLEEGELRDEQLDDRTGGEDGELSR